MSFHNSSHHLSHPDSPEKKDLLDEILERRKNSKSWKRFLSKKILVPIGIAVIAPFILGYFLGDSSKADEVETEFFTLTKTDLETIVSSNGKVVAEDGVSVSFSTVGEQITAVFVAEGDTVSVGDKLASIDTTDLNLDLRSAQNSLNTAYSNLQGKIDGASETEIALQQKSLDSSKANFEKTIENNEYSIQQAETKLANLQKDLESILTGSAETDSTLAAIAQTYENALLKIDSVLTDVKSSLNVASEILDDDKSSYVYLSALDSSKLREAENGFRFAESTYENFLRNFATVSALSEKMEIVAKIDGAIELTDALVDAFDSLYDVFENTTASSTISENEISSFQSSASSWQSKMSTGQQNLISTKQSINSQILSKSEKIESLEENIADAETSLAEVRTSAARSEASAQNSLDVAELNYLKFTEPATTIELSTLRAQINSAQINVTKIKNKIADTTLTAPIDGEIVELHGQIGDLIIQDQNETFATILNKDSFFIEVSIEEVEVNQIQKGQKVIATFDAIEDTEVEGEVSFVSLTSVNSGGIVTYPVRITLKNWGEMPIREGMTAYVDFVIGEAHDILAVPVGAIVSRGDKNFVLMEDGESREVETGFNDGSLVEIISGLVENEKIILSGSAAASVSNSQKSEGGAVFTDEERAALEAMTDEERKAFFEEKGLSGGGMGGGSGGGDKMRVPK